MSSDVTNTYKRRHGPHTQEGFGRPTKRRLIDSEGDERVEINVLLPNGGNVILFEDIDHDMKVEELLRRIKVKATEQDDVTRSPIIWGSHVFLEDTLGGRIEDGGIFKPNHKHSRTLVLQDGQPNAIHSCPDMWNVTPEPEILGALPQEYTLETALADILDNSLQAVWANMSGDRRVISISLTKDKITIFDSGQGMDSSDTNSIAKWGTMGSSRHRDVRTSAIGGNPPFLKPFFGMYGFGGLIAAMHLGGVAVVSSKTKSSKYVVTLTLEKEKLMERCKIDRAWKTPGEFREPTKEELRKSPHGSFTKVELLKLKRKKWKEHQLMCMLKDIYFPYIQCDIADSSHKTTTPVDFEVNATNLTEVEGGEVAVTNMFSCNGAPFVIDIHLKKTSHEPQSVVNAGDLDQGNARITCFYYPIKQGKETIDVILEELEKQQIGTNESFENFCRVAIRRLGRLLPDARWRRLPFMEPKRKRGDKTAVPKICFERVKAFVDTDAGFVPTTSKMDLSHGHVFTNALKNLGFHGVTQDGVEMEILREQRPLMADQLEKEFQEWVKNMHESFDEEVDCEIEPEAIIPRIMKELGFCQDVFRVYKNLKRKGVVWKQGMRVKFLKGIPGYPNKDFYATLEYFLSEGLFEDRGCTKVICRPIDASKEDGSTLSLKDDDASFDLGKSKALSVDLLSSEKCCTVSESDWKRYAEKRSLKSPSCIEILDKQSAEMLGFWGGLESTVRAGSKLPSEIIAVVRPKQYTKLMEEGKPSNPVSQKNIFKQLMEMTLEVKHRASKRLFSPKEAIDENLEEFQLAMVVKGQTVNGVQGLYCFPREGTRLEDLFTKTGRYIFRFSLEPGEFPHAAIITTLEVDVEPSEKIGRWELRVSDDEHGKSQNVPRTRLGSDIGPVFILCYDDYGNMKKITEPMDLKFELWSNEKFLNIDVNYERGMEQEPPPHSYLMIKSVRFIQGSLKGVASDYAACLKLLISNSCKASLSLFVLPGEMSFINAVESQLVDHCLQTNDVIHDMTLQVLDSNGNHVEKGSQVFLKLFGLELQDSKGHWRTVDERGCINLGGLLKVTGPFNSKAQICAFSPKERLLYEREFSLLQRSMRVIFSMPEECHAGGILENIKVLIVDENEHVDKKMDGPHHMILVDACSQNAYPLREGTCIISKVQLPNKPGPWWCRIYHSIHIELEAEIKVNVTCSSSSTSTALSHEDNLFENNPILQIHDRTGWEKEIRKMAEAIIMNIETETKKAERNACKARNSEEELSELQTDKDKLICQISFLEGEIGILEQQAHGGKSSVNHDFADVDQLQFTAEHLTRKIMKADHPARFFMPGRFLSHKGDNPLVKEILGVVSLLAAVENQLLSKALAEFIGEENMLAVVCKTSRAAGLIEKYEEFDGKVDESSGLLKYAQSRKKTMNGRLRVYILQEMRFYDHGHESNDSQKLLKIEAPQLQNGASPNGFLGYAVNLLYLSREHLDLRLSDEVQGLRGTLFYHLFKKLQVYDTRKHLIEAKDALISGGVSLDGGLIRNKGCIDFGVREEEIITFPVTSKSQKHGIPSMYNLNRICQCLQIEDILRRKKKELQESCDSLSAIEARAQHVQRKLDHHKEQWKAAAAEVQSQGHLRDQLEEQLNRL